MEFRIDIMTDSKDLTSIKIRLSVDHMDFKIDLSFFVLFFSFCRFLYQISSTLSDYGYLPINMHELDDNMRDAYC